MGSNKQQLGTVIVLLLIASALISACGTASRGEGTPEPTFAPAALATSTPEPTATALPAAPQSPTPEPTATASPPAPPSPGPEITFPLALNDTWVFQVTWHEGVPIDGIVTMITTTWALTETVVNVKSVSSDFVAQIHQEKSVEMPVAVPESMRGIPLRPAASSDEWLVVSGNRLYRQEKKLDLPHLSTALLEFVFPLEPGEKWYLSDEKAKLYPTYADEWMLRKVTKVGAVVVPAGHFDNCFFLEDAWAGATFEIWFCPDVGVVDKKVDHHGTPEGYRQVLIRYQLNK